MSCHNIGRGMDSVVVQVIKLLEENEIPSLPLAKNFF